MVFVTISTSTPISDQRRRSAWVSAAYWACRIGWTLARSRTGSGRPAERTISTAFSFERCGWRRPGSCPRMPGGIRPVAGRANRPSAPQTKSWVWATPASARRSASREPAALDALRTAK